MSLNQEIRSFLRFNNYIVNHVEFHVNLNVNIFKDAAAKNYPFSISISITGYFEVDGSHHEQKQGVAEVNAVAILFPYIRALVSTITANVNVNPLILPPLNIVKLIESQSQLHSLELDE